MWPRIPLHFVTDDDKVACIINTVRIEFYFPMLRTGHRLTLARNTPYYEIGIDGRMNEKDQKISFFTKGLSLKFECNGIVDRFRERNLTGAAVGTLISAYDYPQKFDIETSSDGETTKIGRLSDIM
ncbi:MAG: hypothetical protein PHG66_01270 [Candidatus Colwellbacteria bacterium]|nr:hypothetical protein [Candidatus Colwellbacteria bacterium]